MVNLESVRAVSMFVNGVLLHSHRINSTENMLLFFLDGHKFHYESHILLALFDFNCFPKSLAPNTFTRRIKISVFKIWRNSVQKSGNDFGQLSSCLCHWEE